MNPSNLGIHMFVFTGRRSCEDIANAAKKAATAGFRFFEIPLLDPDAVDLSLKAVFSELGLTPICSLGLDQSTDISGVDPEIARHGELLLMRALDKAHALGAPLLTGVTYGQLGHQLKLPTPQGREQSQHVLGRVAEAAAERGMQVGLEPVNRYESNLLNTTQQTLDFIDEIGADNLVVHLDVYHMNIEESGFRDPVLAAGKRLGYVHIDESHRGYLGTGTIDFSAFFAALAEIGYTGPITFEAFCPGAREGRLGSALALWRELWSDADELANHAHQFMSEHLVRATESAAPVSHAG